MAWWNYFSEKAAWDRAFARAEKQRAREHAQLQIGEPVRAIVNLIIKYRHRFVLTETLDEYRATYTAFDKQTGETLTVIRQGSEYGYECWGGMIWITSEEARWAYDMIIASQHQKNRLTNATD
jgi:hypothetical protein